MFFYIFNPTIFAYIYIAYFPNIPDNVFQLLSNPAENVCSSYFSHPNYVFQKKCCILKGTCHILKYVIIYFINLPDEVFLAADSNSASKNNLKNCSFLCDKN